MQRSQLGSRKGSDHRHSELIQQLNLLVHICFCFFYIKQHAHCKMGTTETILEAAVIVLEEGAGSFFFLKDYKSTR